MRSVFVDEIDGRDFRVLFNSMAGILPQNECILNCLIAMMMAMMML